MSAADSSGSAVACLEFLLNPGALGRDLDVHVLDADLAAIGLPQDRYDLVQTRALVAEDVVQEDLAIEIGLAEPIAAVIQLRIRPALIEAERVEIGFEMAAHPVGADQLQRADRVGGRLAQCRRIGRLSPAASRHCRPAAPGLSQNGGRSSASTADPSSPISVKNRRQLSSTEAGIVEKARIEIGNEPGVGASQKGCAVDISHQRF